MNPSQTPRVQYPFEPGHNPNQFRIQQWEEQVQRHALEEAGKFMPPTFPGGAAEWVKRHRAPPVTGGAQ